MRKSWIVATLVALLGAAPGAQAQSALDKLKAAEAASKKEKTPEEKAAAKAKAEAAKAKAEAEKAKADAEKAKAEAAKAKAEAEKAKADAEKAKADAGAPPIKDAGAPDAGKSDAGKTAKPPDKDKADETDETDAPAALIQLRSTRDERRKASIEKLRGRWGELAGNPNAKSELERHAKFVANLQRIRTLAEEKKKVKLIEKIDTLLTKEEVRHSTQMNKLRDAAPAVAGGGK